MRNEEIRKKAVYVLGKEAEAEAWLNRPARGLQYRIPSDVMQTEKGRQEVYDLLLRIDYGVYI